MTPATIKTLIEACGLSRREAARYLGIDERNVGNWLTGKFAPVPAHLEKLTDLHELIFETIDERVEALDEDNDLLLVLIRYSDFRDLLDGTPLGVHHAIVRGIYSTDPARVIVIGFDKVRFTSWLDGRADTPETRAGWAHAQVEILSLQP